MKKQKYTWIDALKEILAEFLGVVLGLGVCVIALVIGAILPKSIFEELPFEVLIILAIVAILAVLYVISAIVAVVLKIKSKTSSHKNADK